MTSSEFAEEALEYDDDMIALLEAVWGEGFMSPGGTAEVDRILDGLDLTGLSVLDIGCGLGGATLHVARRYDVATIVGIDIEDNLIEACRKSASRAGLSEKVRFTRVVPGPLPAAMPVSTWSSARTRSFTSRTSTGWPVTSSAVSSPADGSRPVIGLAGYAGAPSAAMQAYIDAEGLDFGLASAAVYEKALTEAGFMDIEIVDRNEWYRSEARRELERLTGVLYAELEAIVGRAFLDREIKVWERMIVVLDQGELRPTHFRGRKP